MKNGDWVTTNVTIRREMKYERFDFLDSLIPISFNRSAEIELEMTFKLNCFGDFLKGFEGFGEKQGSSNF